MTRLKTRSWPMSSLLLPGLLCEQGRTSLVGSLWRFYEHDTLYHKSGSGPGY